MNPAMIATIFELSMKGLNIITTLAQHGADISTGVRALTNIWSKKPGDVTEKDLDETEAILDGLLDEFEKPMSKLEKK